MIERNLVDRFDEIAIGAKWIEIRRSIDEKHLKERMAKANQFEIAEKVAGDELPLAMALVQALAARPR